MKRLIVFVLACSLAAFAQGRPSGAGHPSGTGGGAPSSAGAGMGRSGDMGRPSDVGRPSSGKPTDVGHQAGTQQPLKDSQINGGAWKMLEQKTGKSSADLQAMYAASGAKNFGQFVSAIVVSKNLGFDAAQTDQLLSGLKTKSLGQTLQDMGVPKNKANAEIKKAKKEADAAQKS
jgi:hypothetical protein